MKVKRSERGSMWLLVVCIFSAMVALLIFGTMIFGVYLCQQHAQYTIDQFAMEAAIQLNDSNKAGRMNQLVNRSRQLVASTHDTYDEVFETGHYNLEPLARYLLEQSREGARLVDNSRGLFISDTLKTLSTKTSDRFTNYPFKKINLPWIEVEGPKLLFLSAGRMNNIDSSIYVSEQLDHVAKADLATKLVNPQSKLYKGDVDVRLREDEADIPFKLSSLPAPVRGIISQARLVDAKPFIDTVDLYVEGEPRGATCKYSPSAVNIRSEYKIINRVGPQQTCKLIVSSAAVTTGAFP